MMRRRDALLGVALLPIGFAAARAAPTPLSQPVHLTVGVAKVAHLAPMLTLVQDLGPLGVSVEYAEFAPLCRQPHRDRQRVAGRGGHGRWGSAVVAEPGG